VEVNFLGETGIVNVMHHYSETPPRGWTKGETVTFNVKAHTTVEEFLENINNFRRPTEQIECL